MQNKRISRINIVAVIFCIIILLFAAAITYNIMSRPASDPLAATSELPLFDAADPPPPTQPPPATQPPTEPETEADEETQPPTEPETDPPRIITAHPVRMIIPVLELDYEIQMTISDERGNMQIAPYLDIVSWFDRGAIPGNDGNAIFGSHNIWRGVRSQVYDLDKMEVGDEMIIEYDDGTSIIFNLESVFVYPLARAPAHLIMEVNTEPRVTLITCKPPFNPSTGTSDNRIVAIFREDIVFVIPDPPVEPFPLKN